MRAEAADEQLTRLTFGQHVQRQRVGPVGGDQAGEPVSAGDQGEAARCFGEQRPDLDGVVGIVEQDQHPPAGELAAVQVDLCLRIGRDARWRHTERIEQPADCHVRVGRWTGGVKPPQVEVELPIGEAVDHPVGPMHGQCGLTDAGGAGYRRDHYRRRASCGVKQRIELPQVLGAAGERSHVGRQLPGAGGAGGRGSGCRDKLRPFGVGKAQRVGQQQERVAARVAYLAGLQAADRACRQSRVPC